MTNFNHFRFYLTRAEPHIVFGTVEAIIDRIERVENRLNARIETLLGQLGPADLKARINPDDVAFSGENAGSLTDCRSAVSRYVEFQTWRLTHPH